MTPKNKIGKFNVSHILAFIGIIYLFMFMTAIYSIIGGLIIGIIILGLWIVLELDEKYNILSHLK